MDKKAINGDPLDDLNAPSGTFEPVQVEDQGRQAVFTPAQDFDFMDDPKFNGTMDQRTGKFNISLAPDSSVAQFSDSGASPVEPEIAKKTPFSPLLLRRPANQPLNPEDIQVDPSLVASERYDPQSKAFSYVPASSLQDHFKSPKKPTKMVPFYEQQEQSPAVAPAPAYDHLYRGPSLRAEKSAGLGNNLLDPNFYLKSNSESSTQGPGGSEAPPPPPPPPPYIPSYYGRVPDGGADLDFVENPDKELDQFAPDFRHQFVKSPTPVVYKPDKSWADSIGDPFIYDTPSRPMEPEYRIPLQIQTAGPNLVPCSHCGHGNQTLLASSVAPRLPPIPQQFDTTDFWRPTLEEQSYRHQGLPNRRDVAPGDYYPTPDPSALSTPTGGPLGKTEWLERQMRKLKMKQLDDDVDLKIRRQQERMLLDELKHVHDEKMQKRRRSEQDYTVEGYGARAEGDEDLIPPHYSLVGKIGHQHQQILMERRADQTHEKPLPDLPPHPAISKERFNATQPAAIMQTGHRTEYGAPMDLDMYQPFSTAKGWQPGSFAPSPKSILKKPRSLDAEIPSTSGGPVVDVSDRYSNEFNRQSSSTFEDVDTLKQMPNHRFLRATTPAFPTPGRSETPMPYHPLLYQQQTMRSQAVTPLIDQPCYSDPTAKSYGTMDVFSQHPLFIKDTSKFWYKPKISREEAINMLRDKAPGTFIIRDSNSFPGAFGLALKVATPPPGVQAKLNDGSELVRHFLIEPTAKGVKLKGCNNEPVFGSLAALVYQHSITPLALPTRLLLPDYDPAQGMDQTSKAQALLEQGAACNVTYLHSCDTESLTGPEAVRKTVDDAFRLSRSKQLQPTIVHFKVAAQGITLTDNARRLFFRRHYPVQAVTFCGSDPEDRRWTTPSDANPQNSGGNLTAVNSAARIFGFVAKKSPSSQQGDSNACHVFAEYEVGQPASAVVNFVTKVMMASFRSTAVNQRPHDIVR